MGGVYGYRKYTDNYLKRKIEFWRRMRADEEYAHCYPFTDFVLRYIG